ESFSWNRWTTVEVAEYDRGLGQVGPDRRLVRPRQVPGHRRDHRPAGPQPLPERLQGARSLLRGSAVLRRAIPGGLLSVRLARISPTDDSSVPRPERHVRSLDANLRQDTMNADSQIEPVLVDDPDRRRFRSSGDPR